MKVAPNLKFVNTFIVMTLLPVVFAGLGAFYSFGVRAEGEVKDAATEDVIEPSELTVEELSGETETDHAEISVGQFSLTPSAYDIKLTTMSSVDIEFVMTNNFTETLVFNLGIEEESRTSLEENGLGVEYIGTDGAVDLLSDTAEISVSEGAVQKITIKLTPKIEHDFAQDFVLSFVQSDDAEVKLQTQEYEVEIKVESTVVSNKKNLLKEGGLVGVVILISIVLIVVVIYFLTKEDGKESDQ